VRRFTCDRSTQSIVTYLETFGKRYDCILFIGPLDRIRTLGLDRVVARALVVPFDVPQTALISEDDRALLRQVVAFLFPSSIDRSRVLAIDGTSDGPVVPGAIAPPALLEPKRFRSRYELYEPFFFAPCPSGFSPGCHRLLEYFAHYRSETGSRRKLVLGAVMPNDLDVPGNVDFVNVLSKDETWEAIAACEATVVVDDAEGPELCRQSWSINKPVVADVEALTVVEECRRSGGGLWYADSAEFVATIGLIDERELSILASQGNEYLGRYISDLTVASVLLRFFD
jgi:hypothetical protein